MLNQTFKLVRIKYKDGSQKRHGIFTLVTDIQYHDNYIVIEYYRRPESTDTSIIMTNTLEKIEVEDLRELDAKRDWVEMNNAICGHDFTRIKFWPFDGKKSEIQIHPIYGNQDGSYLLYTNVAGIERKWNHETRGNEIHIRTIDFGRYSGFLNLEKIIIIPEDDIKKMVIQRADHEDLEIKVNGGTYRDE